MNYTIIDYDKTRQLKFTIKAFMDFEKIAHKNVLSVITNLEEESISFLDTVNLLWAGLKDEDNELTPDKVAEILEDVLSKDKKKMSDIWNDLLSALTQSGAFKAFVKDAKGKDEKSEKKSTRATPT